MHELAASIDALWDFNDPEASQAKFAAWLDGHPQAGADERAQVLTQIARCLGLRREFEAALAKLDEVEAGLDGAHGLVEVRYLLERGRVLNSSGRAEEAGPLFVKAWDRARACGADFYAVDAAHMLGIVMPADAALAWNRRALEHAEASSDPRARGWVGSLCNNMGWTHHGAGAFDAALVLFERALAARRHQGKPADIRVARWCRARCLRSLDRVEEALREQRSLLAELDAAGEHDGFVHEELAECLLAQGHADDARPHFARAHELLAKDPWLADSEPDRLSRLATLGGRAAAG